MSLSVVKAGIYVLYDKGEVVYIGESDNLYFRIGQHINEGKKKFDSFDLYETPCRKELEGFLIQAFHPKYNISPGKEWDSNAINGGAEFTSPDIEDAVKAFEGRLDYISFRAVAHDLDEYEETIYKVVMKHKDKVRAWNIDGCWKMDYDWYKDHKNKLKTWIDDMLAEERIKEFRTWTK